MLNPTVNPRLHDQENLWRAVAFTQRSRRLKGSCGVGGQHDVLGDHDVEGRHSGFDEHQIRGRNVVIAQLSMHRADNCWCRESLIRVQLVGVSSIRPAERAATAKI